MDFNREKFKALVHYVCWSCKDDTSKLGSTKLNKILWLADFVTYYRSGEPITGATYIRRQFGPVPRAIMPVLAELERDGAVFARKILFHGKPKTDFIVAKNPEINLSDDEKRLIDLTIRFVCDENTAKSISELSHDSVWHAAKDGEDIPYYTIFAAKGEIDEDDREWARQEIEGIEVA
jgi:Protein of unknown function (DUF4065)